MAFRIRSSYVYIHSHDWQASKRQIRLFELSVYFRVAVAALRKLCQVTDPTPIRYISRLPDNSYHYNYYNKPGKMPPIRRYLRISKYSVLESRIYLENPSDTRWLLNPRDPVLPRLFAAIRPLVVPKLREENERLFARKKGHPVKDVIVEGYSLPPTSSTHLSMGFVRDRTD